MIELYSIIISYMKFFSSYHKMFMLLLVIEMISLNIVCILSNYVFLIGCVMFFMYLFVIVMEGVIGLSVLMKNFRFKGGDFIDFLMLC